MILLMNNDNNLRITISLNKDFAKDIEFLMKNLNISKSEVFKLAFEKFSNEYKKNNLKRVAEIMKDEYKNNKELIEFSSIDGDSFL